MGSIVMAVGGAAVMIELGPKDTSTAKVLRTFVTFGIMIISISTCRSIKLFSINKMYVCFLLYFLFLIVNLQSF